MSFSGPKYSFCLKMTNIFETSMQKRNQLVGTTNCLNSHCNYVFAKKYSLFCRKMGDTQKAAMILLREF